MLDRTQHIEEILDGARFLRRKAFGYEALKGINITASQWLVMGYIFRNEGCTVNDAATALRMTGSAVTQLVNGLVAKKYIKRERDPHDLRAHRLFLPSANRKRLNNYKQKRMRMMQQVFNALTDKEFTQYLALNNKLIRAASGEDV